jgi:hypothetical protein
MFTHENVELPLELQPSTRAWGVMGQFSVSQEISKYRLSFSHRSEFNMRNQDNYLYGNMYSSSIAISGNIRRKIMAQVGFRNEIKQSDKTPTNAKLASEGSNIVIFAPKIGYRLPADFHVRCICRSASLQVLFRRTIKHAICPRIQSIQKLQS